MKIVAGNSNRPLAEAICAHLKVPLTKGQVKRFADMEIFVEIQENVRGQDVFVIQSTSFPANDNLMELLILIDALKRASAAPHHGGHPLLRLRPPGSQARPAHADLGQARRQPDRARRRRPRADARSARRPDPGLLRHPDRQPVRRAGHGARHPGAATARNNLMVVSPDVGGVVRARGARQAHRCADRHLRQAPRAPRRVRGHERHRRRQGQALHPDRRHRRFRRHAGQRRRGAAEARRHRGDGLHHARRAVGRRGQPHPELAASSRW